MPVPQTARRRPPLRRRPAGRPTANIGVVHRFPGGGPRSSEGIPSSLHASRRRASSRPPCWSDAMTTAAGTTSLGGLSSRAEQQTEFVPPKPKEFGHRVPGSPGDAGVGNVVEVALGVRRRVVHRGGNHASRSAREQNIPSMAPAAPRSAPSALGGTDGDRLRAVAEHGLDRHRFVQVVVGRGGAVRVDVIDLGRGDAGRRPGPTSLRAPPPRPRRRALHGTHRPTRVPQKLRIDPRPPLPGVLELLEDQDRRAFPHDEANPVPYRRDARAVSGWSLRVDRAFMEQNRPPQRGDRGSGAARDHSRTPVADRVHPFADRVAGRRA